jgi:hypothetical protein
MVPSRLAHKKHSFQVISTIWKKDFFQPGEKSFFIIFINATKFLFLASLILIDSLKKPK